MKFEPYGEIENDETQRAEHPSESEAVEALVNLIL